MHRAWEWIVKLQVEASGESGLSGPGALRWLSVDSVRHITALVLGVFFLLCVPFLCHGHDGTLDRQEQVASVVQLKRQIRSWLTGIEHQAEI
jgi:hypothetical protein